MKILSPKGNRYNSIVHHNFIYTGGSSHFILILLAKAFMLLFFYGYKNSPKGGRISTFQDKHHGQGDYLKDIVRGMKNCRFPDHTI